MKNQEKILVGLLVAVIISFGYYDISTISLSDSILTAQAIGASPSPSLSPIPTTSSRIIPPSTNPKTDDIATQVTKVQIANAKLKQFGDKPIAISIAKERQSLMKFLAKADARRFLEVTLSAKVRSKLISEAAQYVEKKGVTTGRLEVMHVDDFQNHANSRFDYTLNVAQKRYTLYTPAKLSERGSGPVQVAGFALDNLIVLSNGDPSLIPLAGQDTPDAVGNQRVLALIVEPQGVSSTVTVDEVEKVLFAPASPFEVYFKNQSYGKVWFTGKAYKIKLDRAVDAGVCYTGGKGVSIWDQDVRDGIKALTVDLSTIDRIIFISNIYGGCSEIGKGQHFIDEKTYKFSTFLVGWDHFRYVLDNNLMPTIIAHEMGHSLGVWHANALLCDAGDVCQHNEYGNFFDVMGVGLGDFNALYKEQLSWLIPTDFLNITTNGDYSIRGIENMSGYRAAKVINPLVGPLSVMYLETRTKPILNSAWTEDTLFDQGFGLLLNIPQDPSRLKDTAPELIDMNPQDDYYRHVALKQGGIAYTPNSSGVTFSSVHKASLGGNDEVNFHVDVVKPTCISRSPQILPDNYIQIGMPGGSVTIGRTITNVDVSWCFGPSDFKTELSGLPNGWTINTESPSATVTIPPDYLAYLGIKINIPIVTPPGQYAVNYTVKNLLSGKAVSIIVPVEIRSRPQIISIDKKVVNAGDGINIVTNYISGTYVEIIGGNSSGAFFLFRNTIPSNGIIPAFIPNMMYSIDDASCKGKGECLQIPLSSGVYDIILYVFGGLSDPVPITINGGTLGKLLIDEKPTLTLTYDNTRRESALTANFPITVVAGSTDLHLYKNYGSVIFTNNNQKSIPTPTIDGSLQITAPPNGAQSIVDKKGLPVFVIPAGQESKFSVVSTVDPKIIPSGIYTASLSQLWSVNNNDISAPLTIPQNQTNVTTIIGEKAPYITEVISVESKCKDAITVKGIRFHPTNNTLIFIDIQTRQIVKQFPGIMSQNNGTLINFVPSYAGGIKSGQYYLTVTNASMGSVAGLSNGSDSFTISNKIGTRACPPIPSPSTTPSPKVAPIMPITCPINYICTPPGTTSYCPSGSTCTTVTSSCPSGYSCTTYSQIKPASSASSPSLSPSTSPSPSTSLPVPTQTSTPSGSPSPSPSTSPRASVSSSPSTTPSPSSSSHANKSSGVSFLASVFYSIGDFLDSIFTHP